MPSITVPANPRQVGDLGEDIAPHRGIRAAPIVQHYYCAHRDIVDVVAVTVPELAGPLARNSSVGAADEAKSRIERLDSVALADNSMAVERVAECRGIDSRRALNIWIGYVVLHEFNPSACVRSCRPLPD